MGIAGGDTGILAGLSPVDDSRDGTSGGDTAGHCLGYAAVGLLPLGNHG